MKSRILIVLTSILVLVTNVILYFPIALGGLKYIYRAPDEKPPLNLTNEAFGNIASLISLVLILFSSIYLVYIIFKGKSIEQLVTPTLFTFGALIIVVISQPNYRVSSESMYPQGKYYYWSQERIYKEEIKYIRWKRLLNDKEENWVVDSTSITPH